MSKGPRGEPFKVIYEDAELDPVADVMGEDAVQGPPKTVGTLLSEVTEGVIPKPLEKQFAAQDRVLSGRFAGAVVPDVALRPGRAPAFTRAEVDAIRADHRTLAEIAEAYGVSITTIRRVKRMGVYKGWRYMPADETTDDAIVMENLPVEIVQPRSGRPYAKRGTPLTDEDIEFIRTTPRSTRTVAELMGVSHATIARLRRAR